MTVASSYRTIMKGARALSARTSWQTIYNPFCAPSHVGLVRDIGLWAFWWLYRKPATFNRPIGIYEVELQIGDGEWTPAGRTSDESLRLDFGRDEDATVKTRVRLINADGTPLSDWTESEGEPSLSRRTRQARLALERHPVPGAAF